MKKNLLSLLLPLALLSACGARTDTALAVGSSHASHARSAAAPMTSLVLYGARSAYTVQASGSGFMLTDLSGKEAPRQLGAATRLLFTDGALALDTAGAAGQTYRLYQAAFNRQPDLAGLSFWIGQMDSGATLEDLSGAFIGSAEFAAMYGSAPSAETFVGKLYDNVLHRAYDQAGFDFWVGQVKNGGARAAILAAFSESPENLSQTAPAIANGIAYTAPLSSFAQLQKQIFSPACVSCHNATLASGGLNLDLRAYPNLINAGPNTQAATEAGFKLVKPGEPEHSLLYQKLLMWDPNHSPRYGSAMPLGGSSLSAGQLEFVRLWIAAGAPELGNVADAALLADKTAPVYQSFTPLAAPPAGQGYQLVTGQFSVAADFERELFVYRKLGNAAPVYVSKIETKMRNNSHHLLAYTFNASTPAFATPALDVVRDIRNPDNSMNFLNMLPMGYHIFFGGSMTNEGGYTFPEGVALKLPANAALDLNAHFVNTGADPILGEAFINLHTIDAAKVAHVATTLDLGNTSLSLPPNTRTVVSKNFSFAVATKILMLTSHTHARGERFVVRIKGGTRDGEIVYDSHDWDSPEIITYNPPISLKAGEGLTSEITYNNTTKRFISFGLTSEDEMGIIFGYAY